MTIDEVNNTIERIGTENSKMLNGLVARLEDIEKKVVRGGGDGGSDLGNSWGRQFTNTRAGELADLESSRGRTSLEVRAALTTSTADADGSAGGMSVPKRDQVLGMPKQRLLVRSLLNVVQVETGGSVEYAEQVGRTNNAAVTEEAQPKPESSLQYELKQVPLRVIAHYIKASRQALSDVPQLEGIIDSELRYGLALVEEQELLFGAGGQNLEGMVPQATAYADSLGLVDPTEIDTIGSAILQATLTDIPPDGIIMHPSDWWRMRMAKNADGEYILGSPMTTVQPSLFGLPVAVTPAMPVDKFLLGAFAEQTLYDRWTARVEVGFSGTDFTDNLVTVLGEERVGLATKRPDALIYGDFGNVT
ncbi:phage major capsid protein [Qipengyuania sp. NPDC077563]|uniref:phage major capsid protein n=1 Tax=Qipengyuania sp. NPDC077563 TaxID=3364497 RepID=UPI00384D5AFD